MLTPKLAAMMERPILPRVSRSGFRRVSEEATKGTDEAIRARPTPSTFQRGESDNMVVVQG